jgi:hypothetical protein
MPESEPFAKPVHAMFRRLGWSASYFWAASFNTASLTVTAHASCFVGQISQIANRFIPVVGECQKDDRMVGAVGHLRGPQSTESPF